MNKISFSDIVKTLKTHEPKSPSNWWGRNKIYLGYSDQKGWAIYELSLWDRICRNLFGKYEETRLEYIKEKLRALPQSEIEAITQNENNKALRIALFSKTSRIFMEIWQIYHNFETSKSEPEISTVRNSAPKLSKQDPSLTTYIETLLKGARVPLHPVQFPLCLSNRGNRCYLNSVLQLMLCQVEIRQKILNAFDENVRNMEEFDAINTQLENLNKQQEDNEDPELRQNLKSQEDKLLKQWIKLNLEVKKHPVLKLLAALILHLEAQKQDEYSEIVDDLVDQIRSELFKSELHNDLRGNAYQQQDAGIIIEIMFKDLLGNLVETTTVDQSNTNAELRSVRNDLKSALIVNFNKSKGKEIPSLAHLIAQSFEPETITRNFNNIGQTGQIISPAITTSATSQTRITHLPDVVVVHINRTTFDHTHGSRKTNRAVALPHTIDLAPYCVQNREESYQYELIGYNVHTGASLRGGHYTAYLKIDANQCFKCDDLNRFHYQGMSKEEFYGEALNPAASQAYLAMFRRIKVPATTTETNPGTSQTDNTTSATAE